MVDRSAVQRDGTVRAYTATVIAPDAPGIIDHGIPSAVQRDGARRAFGGADAALGDAERQILGSTISCVNM